jgi:hypothetical protein
MRRLVEATLGAERPTGVLPEERRDGVREGQGAVSSPVWAGASAGASPPGLAARLTPSGALKRVEGEGRGGLPPWGARPWRSVESEGA